MSKYKNEFVIVIYCTLLCICSYSIGRIGTKSKQNQQVINMYNMKQIPNAFQLACGYMLEGDETTAKHMVDVYNFINKCKGK